MGLFTFPMHNWIGLQLDFTVNSISRHSFAKQLHLKFASFQHNIMEIPPQYTLF